MEALWEHSAEDRLRVERMGQDLPSHLDCRFQVLDEHHQTHGEAEVAVAFVWAVY